LKTNINKDGQKSMNAFPYKTLRSPAKKSKKKTNKKTKQKQQTITKKERKQGPI
jgi:hypothetical protein